MDFFNSEIAVQCARGSQIVKYLSRADSSTRFPCQAAANFSLLCSSNKDSTVQAIKTPEKEQLDDELLEGNQGQLVLFVSKVKLYSCYTFAPFSPIFISENLCKYEIE